MLPFHTCFGIKLWYRCPNVSNLHMIILYSGQLKCSWIQDPRAIWFQLILFSTGRQSWGTCLVLSDITCCCCRFHFLVGVYHTPSLQEGLAGWSPAKPFLGMRMTNILGCFKLIDPADLQMQGTSQACSCHHVYPCFASVCNVSVAGQDQYLCTCSSRLVGHPQASSHTEHLQCKRVSDLHRNKYCYDETYF